VTNCLTGRDTELSKQAKCASYYNNYSMQRPKDIKSYAIH